MILFDFLFDFCTNFEDTGFVIFCPAYNSVQYLKQRIEWYTNYLKMKKIVTFVSSAEIMAYDEGNNKLSAAKSFL